MSATSPSLFDLFVSIVTSEKFIAAFLGLIGGTIATLIAPWTKWHFKEKELRRENRKEKLAHWREEINKHKSITSFFQTVTYQELREYIPQEEMTNLLKDDGIHVVFGIQTTTRDSRVLTRFHRVVSEKEWGII